jgi:signal transduction histidine kinase
MENILSKKFKRLGWVFSISLIVFISLSILICNRTWTKIGDIRSYISSHIKKTENQLQKIMDLMTERIKRIETWKEDDFDNMQEDECLVILEKDGRLKKYYGHLYYFSIKDSLVGDFYLINKKGRIFFVKKLRKDTYYIRIMFLLDDFNKLNRDKVSGLGSKIKYYDQRIPKSTIDRTIKNLNKEDGIVHYCRVILSNSNDQLLYDLELSEFQLHRHNQKYRIMVFLMMGILFLLLQVIYMLSARFKSGGSSQIYNRLIFIFSIIMLLLLFLLSSQFSQKSIFLKISLYRVNSIFNVLIISILIFAILLFFLRKINLSLVSAIILFLVSQGVVFIILKEILGSTIFPFYRFILDPLYISLLISQFFLYFIPFLFLYRVKPASSKKEFIFSYLLLITGALYFLNQVSNLIIILAAGIFIYLLSSKKEIIKGFILVFFIATAISLSLFKVSKLQKEQYISDSLRTIFVSQNNYAKFILRSIVAEIEYSNYSYDEFFEEDKEFELKSIWEASLAAEENVPSGIFIVPNPESSVLINSYFYQMEYYGKEGITQFPFWVIEDRTVEINNKQITYAVALRQVFKRDKYIGDIVIQVINSPELILRFQEEDNIFTINKKINGNDISYIKFDTQNQVIENPGNIDLRVDDQPGNNWFSFNISNRKYYGYKFNDQGSTIVIYYPEQSVFTIFANYVKIILFLMGLFYLFNIGLIKKMKWKGLYYSFSIRVFIILILLSVFTAAIFSVFSVNFNSDLIDRNFNGELLKKGRITQNTVFEVLRNNDSLSRSSLFNLSKIINQAISVYKLDDFYHLIFVSNYRMETNNDVPVVIPSQDLKKLNGKNEKMVIVDNGDSIKLIFKVRNYIFVIKIFKDKSVIFHERKQYLDFITSLVFILGLLGLSAAILFRKKILMPIEDLSEGMSEVEKGNLISLQDLPDETDLKRLYIGFNKMVKGIRGQRQKISEMSKLKTVIKLGRRVAHEVKNPLTPIKLSAEQIERSIIDKNPGYEELIKDSVKYIVDETEHLKKVSYGFLNLSRIDELNKEFFDISAFMREQYHKFSLSYSNTDFSYQDKIQGREVFWDKLKVEEIINNIISNSVDAISPGQQGQVSITIQDYKKDKIEIIIIDNGIGIAQKDINDIFRENYTRKDIGTGLGLFISKRIASLHQGEIMISSEKGKGTTVRVVLPVEC